MADMSGAASRTDRRAVGIALAWGLVLAAGTLFLLLSRDDPVAPVVSDSEPEDSRVLVLPETAAGFELSSTAESLRLARRAKRGLQAGNPDGETVVGIYAGDRQSLYYAGLTVTGDSANGVELARSPAGAIEGYLGGAGVVGLRELDPGPLGGALACGRFEAGGSSGNVACGWADASTLGSLTFLGDDPGAARLTLEEAALITVDFRGAAERLG